MELKALFTSIPPSSQGWITELEDNFFFWVELAITLRLELDQRCRQNSLALSSFALFVSVIISNNCETREKLNNYRRHLQADCSNNIQRGIHLFKTFQEVWKLNIQAKKNNGRFFLNLSRGFSWKMTLSQPFNFLVSIFKSGNSPFSNGVLLCTLQIS